jgi:hypothetical protein
MFFGVQGIVVAISAALNDPVWLNVSRIGSYQDANGKWVISAEGPHIMTYIVIGVCSLAFIASLFLPKYFKNIGRKNINI